MDFKQVLIVFPRLLQLRHDREACGNFDCVFVSELSFWRCELLKNDGRTAICLIQAFFDRSALAVVDVQVSFMKNVAECQQKCHVGRLNGAIVSRRRRPHAGHFNLCLFYIDYCIRGFRLMHERNMSTFSVTIFKTLK